MTYSETTEYLFRRLPMYQRDGAPALKPGLDNIRQLCEIMGNPQNYFDSIHVAGTNGKGSTCSYLNSILMESGYRTGLFTSPHLIDFRERIRVDGEMISEDKVVEFVEVYKECFEAVDASFFEFSTAMAFWFFKEMKVEVAIIETGLGGRLDSTNIVTPILSVITSIGMDHQQFLGNTIEEIAGEKAGIIKKNVPVVLGANAEMIYEVVKKKSFHEKSDLYFVGNREFSSFQEENLATVKLACEVLNESGLMLEEGNINKGISAMAQNSGLRGRWEELSSDPWIICDVAHNQDGVRKVLSQVDQLNFNKLHVIFGMVSDKDVKSVMELFPKKGQYYFCRANIPRARDTSELAEVAKEIGLIFQESSKVSEAVDSAVEAYSKGDLILILGSVFVVGEALSEKFS